MLPSLGRDGCQPIADSIARGLRGGQGVEEHEPIYKRIADHLCELNDDCFTRECGTSITLCSGKSIVQVDDDDDNEVPRSDCKSNFGWPLPPITDCHYIEETSVCATIEGTCVKQRLTDEGVKPEIWICAVELGAEQVEVPNDCFTVAW